MAVIGNTSLVGAYMGDEYGLSQRRPHRIPVFFLALRRYPAQVFPQSLFQISILQSTDHLDHRQATPIAPSSSLFLHPVGIQPMVAFTCPQAFQAIFQPFSERHWGQVFPVPFQISLQFPDVLFLFGAARFTFQHIQTAMHSFPIMLPYLMMQTVNQGSIPDKAKTLTDFFVHMIPIPKMFMASASCCQLVEHVFRIPTASVAVAQYGALGQIVMIIQIGIQEFQDMLPVESGNNVQSCQDPSLADLLHSGCHLELVFPTAHRC